MNTQIDYKALYEQEKEVHTILKQEYSVLKRKATALVESLNPLDGSIREVNRILLQMKDEK